jgi:hypothetical protein
VLLVVLLLLYLSKPHHLLGIVTHNNKEMKLFPTTTSSAAATFLALLLTTDAFRMFDVDCFTNHHQYHTSCNRRNTKYTTSFLVAKKPNQPSLSYNVCFRMTADSDLGREEELLGSGSEFDGVDTNDVLSDSDFF